jgi:hypothetical protein
MPVQIHRIWLHVWFFLCWKCCIEPTVSRALWIGLVMPVQIHRIWLHVWFFLCWIYRLYRVGQNHKYMVYIRYCWLEKLPKITKYTINVYIYGSGQPYVYTPYIWRYVWSSANPAVSRAILIHRVQEPFVPCFKSLARSAYCLLCHASNRWRAVRIARRLYAVSFAWHPYTQCVSQTREWCVASGMHYFFPSMFLPLIHAHRVSWS